MATLPRNDAQLRRDLMPRLKVVVDYVMTKIAERNQLEIETNVYRRGTPSIYERTGQFKKAWKTDKAQISGMRVQAKFHYEPSEMGFNPNMAIPQHGSNDLENWGDAREYLAELIYNGASGPKYGDGYWTKRRDAWEGLIEDIDGADIIKWTREGFAQAGLTVTKKRG